MTPFWLPAVVSFLFGLVYLFYGDARPPYKVLLAVLFCVAVYLQFFSRQVVAGLLLQVALAVYLAIWLRVSKVMAHR